MQQVAYIALAIVLALTLGFAGGWHAKGVSVDAGKTKTAQAETKAVVADVKQQATEQHDAAVAEQGKTLGVAVAQNEIRAHEAATKQEIAHAVFQPAPINPAAVDCPDPGATAEFMRLYNAAAAGKSEAAGAPAAR